MKAGRYSLGSFSQSRLCLLFLLVYPALSIAAGTTERVSDDSNGVQGNLDSWNASISADGRYVAFRSDAWNLVPEDNLVGNKADVFVHDRASQSTVRVSVDSTGVGGNDSSSGPSISSDGRYVAFNSTASNLVPGDTNGSFDVFVFDRVSLVNERVSVDSAGIPRSGFSDFEPSISSDGRYVAFDSTASNLVPGDSNGTIDVFVHDRVNQATERVSVDSTGVEGNGGSISPSISADGRYVAFDSIASNLVPGDSNGSFDVFVYDRVSQSTERVSLDSAGVEGNGRSLSPSISADGRFVAFDSIASNLVPEDSNGRRDVFVHDRVVKLLLMDLIAQVKSLNLQAGISNALDAKIEATTRALDDLNENNNAAACNALEAFVNAVEAQSDQQISAADALDLINATEAVLEALGCI